MTYGLELMLAVFSIVQGMVSTIITQQRIAATGVDRCHQQCGLLGFYSVVGGYADWRAADYGFIFYHDSHGLRQNVQSLDVRRYCADSAVYIRV